MHSIKLHDIVKRYGEILALDYVNLEVGRGDLLAVLGPNGAGKTTLLRIIAGIEEATSGEIYYDDSKMNKEYSTFIRQRCTLVFQKTAVFNTTVYNNVAYGLKIRELPKVEIETRVREVLRLVDLDGYERRSARKLSGGEQQRVSLARALVLEPEFLLLDEPTANLDPKTTSIVEEVIRYMNKEKGTTIVVATHNLFQVGNIAKNAALMLNGKIVETCPVEEFFQKPSLSGFARLENVFLGTARQSGDGTSLVDISGGVTLEAAFKKTGRVIVHVRPEDIILSKRLLKSSARNVLRGRIVEVLDQDSVVKLKVDVGKIFTIQVTKRSFKEMELNIGSEVFLVCKASSVNLV